MRRLSLTPDKERLRATLVIGLIASIIGLRLYIPEATTPRVSLIFGVLLTYWFLYAILTAYGISETENVKLSNRLRFLGDLSFHSAAYVVLGGVLVLVFMEKSGILRVLEWNYFTVWSSMIIAYLAPQITRFLWQLKSWRQFPDQVRSNWRAVLERWILFFIMSSPLLLLQFYTLIF
jgi:hypothetical protein